MDCESQKELLVNICFVFNVLSVKGVGCDWFFCIIFRTWNISILDEIKIQTFPGEMHKFYLPAAQTSSPTSTVFTLMQDKIFFPEICTLNMWSCLKFAYEVLNQTAQNQFTGPSSKVKKSKRENRAMTEVNSHNLFLGDFSNSLIFL